MNELKLHHIGVAVKNIEQEFEIFKKLGYTKISEVFTEPVQKIKGVHISAKGQPTLELLENLTPDGPLTNLLKKRTKFYHFAYITNNIEKDTDMFVQQHNAFVIIPPYSSTYFEKICFMMLPNQMIIELVQEKVNNGRNN